MRNCSGSDNNEARELSHSPASGTILAQKSARAPEPDAPFRLEPHICRGCLSRLVSRAVPGQPGRLYVCTNCGVELVGAAPDAACCCGTKISRPRRDGTSGYRMVDAGIRCRPNPAPTPEFPSLIVAVEDGAF